MGPDACREIQQAFASGDDAMREVQAMWALFPEPSRAEAALLVEYDPRLREVHEGGHRRGDRGDELDPGGEDAPPEDDQEQ